MSRILPKKEKRRRSVLLSRGDVRKESDPSCRKTRMAAFRLLPGAFVYPLVFFFSMLFTQALRSPVSAMLFVFVQLIPAAGFLYMLLNRAALRVQCSNTVLTGQKNRPLPLVVRLSNRSPLPVPMAEVTVTLPDSRGIRCENRLLRLPLTPFGTCSLLENPVFLYRGKYELRIDSVYVYDLFRMFRIRKRIDAEISVYILPQTRDGLKSKLFAPDTSVNPNVPQHGSSDREEPYGIRAYAPGDRMKDIHWKLSSKAQEPVVREYTGEAESTVFICADFSVPRTDSDSEKLPDDLGAYLTDCVADTALTLAKHTKQEGRRCTVLWYGGDRETDIRSFTPHESNGIALLAKELSRAEILSSSRSVFELAFQIDPAQCAAILFVTGNPDSGNPSTLTRLKNRFGEHRYAVEIFYADPACHAENKLQHSMLQKKTALYHKRIASYGTPITDISP